jgi:hypothetical protein
VHLILFCYWNCKNMRNHHPWGLVDSKKPCHSEG